MQYIARMQFSWKIIVSLILAFIVQISWAANSEELNGKTDFCGVQIKFSGKPKIDNNTKWLSEILGPYDKYTISALSYSGYKLFELAACICREDTVSEMVIFGGISPSETAINHKKRNIPNVGSSESWQVINEPTNSKTLFQFTPLASRPLCGLFQLVQSPKNSTEDLNFINSLTEIKSTVNLQSNVTARERLLQLDSLRKDGLITQSDFETKKKIILDSL